MRRLPDHSIDAILTDPPYGTMDAAWDRSPVDLEAWWNLVRRVLKPNGIVACFAAGRFLFRLHASNPEWYRYDLVWEKSRPVGFLDANRMPLRAHEHILIFAPRLHASYWPQKIRVRSGAQIMRRPKSQSSSLYRGAKKPTIYVDDGRRHPRTVLRFDSVSSGERLHPTQKPLELMRWLVRTYTRPGGLVCDPFMGSGTTAEACAIEGRRIVGIERAPAFFRRALKRVNDRRAKKAKRFVLRRS